MIPFCSLRSWCGGRVHRAHGGNPIPCTQRPYRITGKSAAPLNPINLNGSWNSFLEPRAYYGISLPLPTTIAARTHTLLAIPYKPFKSSQQLAISPGPKKFQKRNTTPCQQQKREQLITIEEADPASRYWSRKKNTMDSPMQSAKDQLNTTEKKLQEWPK